MSLARCAWGMGPDVTIPTTDGCICTNPRIWFHDSFAFEINNCGVHVGVTTAVSVVMIVIALAVVRSTREYTAKYEKATSVGKQSTTFSSSTKEKVRPTLRLMQLITFTCAAIILSNATLAFTPLESNLFFMYRASQFVVETTYYATLYMCIVAFRSVASNVMTRLPKRRGRDFGFGSVLILSNVFSIITREIPINALDYMRYVQLAFFCLTIVTEIVFVLYLLSETRIVTTEYIAAGNSLDSASSSEAANYRLPSSQTPLMVRQNTSGSDDKRTYSQTAMRLDMIKAGLARIRFTAMCVHAVRLLALVAAAILFGLPRMDGVMTPVFVPYAIAQFALAFQLIVTIDTFEAMKKPITNASLVIKTPTGEISTGTGALNGF